MKKVLVTGAGGMIGFHVIKHLLKSKNYEITALDLKNSKVVKKFRKLKKQINIVYGDINNKVLINSLVKDHDYVIHLAAVLPPMADYKPELTKIVNYEGTKNIVQAINEYNPSCFLIYSSSISVYGDRLENYSIKVGDELKTNEYDIYASYKIKTEKYIQKYLKNWTIFRLTAVMGRPNTDPLMFHMPLDTKLEICSDIDAALAFSKSIEYKKELNRKIFNLGGGEKNRTTYRDFLIEMLKIYGLNFRLLETRAFAEKNFHCGYYEDGDKLENILHFRKDTLDSYYKRVLKETNKVKRFFSKILSKPIIFFLQRKSEPYKAHKNKDKKMSKRFFKKDENEKN